MAYLKLTKAKLGVSAKKKDIKCLSIDIGTKYVKCVTGQRINNKLKIDKTFKIKLPDDIYENGHIKNTDEMKSILQKALSDNGVKIKQVICTIESSYAIKREIIVPAVEGEDLSEMVSYEIGQYLPIDINSYVLQYKIAREFEEDNVKKYELFVVALAKDIVGTIYNTLVDIGLEPYALDIHSNAVDKLSSEYNLINGADDKESTIAFIDIGYQNINVIIIEKGIYRFNRLIKNGTMDFEISDSNIDEIKSIDEIADNTAILENWISEIDKVFKYYTSRSVDNIIDKIYIYGGISVMKGLDTYISERLNIPVEKVKSIQDVDLISYDEDTLSDYLNAISAVIRL